MEYYDTITLAYSHAGFSDYSIYFNAATNAHFMVLSYLEFAFTP